MEVTRFEDARAFLDRTAPFLAAEPVLTTVLGSVAARAATRPAPPASAGPHWWATVEDDGAVAGVAMRVAPWFPHPVYVSAMPEAAARALAAHLLTDEPTVTQVNGARPAADTIAAALAEARGHEVDVAMHLRLFELGALAAPAEPPGRWRPATRADEELVAEWFDRFHAEADEQAGRPPDPNPPTFGPGELAARLDEGLVSLWESPDGEVVHLTGWNAPASGVVRVGPVYTPPAHRGRGYAAAAVARISAAVLAAGHRAILFTDQANPSSNALYRRLGYEPVTDLVNLAVVPGDAAAHGR